MFALHPYGSPDPVRSRLGCTIGRRECLERAWTVAAHSLTAHLIDRAHDGSSLHAAAGIGARRARRTAFAAVAGAPVIAIRIGGARHGRLITFHRREFSLPGYHTG